MLISSLIDYDYLDKLSDIDKLKYLNNLYFKTVFTKGDNPKENIAIPKDIISSMIIKNMINDIKRKILEEDDKFPIKFSRDPLAYQVINVKQLTEDINIYDYLMFK